jgi:D-glycero-D-manno-heptose 1,7-bisphosphate phosphatase
MNAAPHQQRRGAVFFDRDGVLNEEKGFVFRVADFRWIEGAREAVKLVNEAGLHAIVVTNQSGVARGYFDEADVRRLHDWMASDLAGVGARIDAFYYCPYHGEATRSAYAIADHPDRKPNPGMILRAMRDFAIDRDRSLVIGDQPSDLEAARRAGLDGRLFSGGSLAAMVGKLLSETAR